MQIHNIMVLIFITCAVINHLFSYAFIYVCYGFIYYVFFLFYMIQAHFK